MVARPGGETKTGEAKRSERSKNRGRWTVKKKRKEDPDSKQTGMHEGGERVGRRHYRWRRNVAMGYQELEGQGGRGLEAGWENTTGGREGRVH